MIFLNLTETSPLPSTSTSPITELIRKYKYMTISSHSVHFDTFLENDRFLWEHLFSVCLGVSQGVFSVTHRFFCFSPISPSCTKVRTRTPRCAASSSPTRSCAGKIPRTSSHTGMFSLFIFKIFTFLLNIIWLSIISLSYLLTLFMLNINIKAL